MLHRSGVCVLLFVITYFIFNQHVNLHQKLMDLPDTIRTKYDKGIHAEHVSVLSLITSSNTQLEFFTLIGIIFNAIMQGYVAVNSIYTFLVQDITVPPTSA